MNKENFITLTTDFGLADTYVAEIKGVIFQRNPTAQIIDLTHAIAAQDIIAGALTIHASYQYFPLNTVHMIVIDPGVGSDRAILAAQCDDYTLIAPDNGLLSLFLKNKLLHTIHKIENKSLFRHHISSTFHGRDIMAPVAAQLAMGLNIQEVGSLMDPSSCIQIECMNSTWENRWLCGKIIHVDHFGNIRTSITEKDLRQKANSSLECLEINGHIINMLSISYSQHKPGELLSILDSGGFVEIAVNQGNAAESLAAQIGDPVRIYLKTS
ncbi:MAG: SAM-dependent chlorinase/fluorinase [Desulfobulbaceae bacterium]|nr:SAM-dependent chlorinase/fluorinase [Desulfobulbaceae bacterium]